jgi:hypothetical protein
MIDRPTALHCLVLAILLAPTFACDPCEGHDAYKSEHWCNNDSVVVCRGESSGNRVEVVGRCMAGGCYKDPSTGQLGCRVPDLQSGRQFAGLRSPSGQVQLTIRWA